MDLDTVDALLTTTRSVRKRLDFTRSVDPEVIERCLEIAMQAPSSSNRQHWHFVVLTGADQRAQVAEYYRKAFMAYIGDEADRLSPQDAASPLEAQNIRVKQSAIYLANNMHKVPVLVIPCIEGRVEKGSQVAQAALYGSIVPAAWSFMLALRARGLGSAWTTLHLHYEREVADVLGIPKEITQAALLPVAYYKGEGFKPARRLPASQRTYWNRWGQTR